MKLSIRTQEITIQLTPADIDTWAQRYPCYSLRGKSLIASYDATGLSDLMIFENGESINPDSVDGYELRCLTSGSLKGVLPESHPAWYVSVGQYK
jgi:hypothetical protein